MVKAAVGASVMAVALSVWQPSAEACEMADQYRLLPLGTSKGRIVALELDQFRDQRTPSAPVLWFVVPRLVYADPGQAVRDIRTYDKTELRARKYVEDLAPLLARARADAKRLPGFREAKVESFTDCHYARDCGAHQILSADASTVRSEIGKRKWSRTKIRLPERFLLHTNAMAMIGADSLGTLDSNTIAAKHPELLELWRLGSVRIYELAGNKRIAVYNLGDGDTRYYRATADPKPRKRKLGTRAAGSFAYDEDLPHHGYAFDLVAALD
jgi:hypothetical protein